MAIGAVVAIGALTAYTIWKVRERRRAMASTPKQPADPRSILGFAEASGTFGVFPSYDGGWTWSINAKAQQGKEATRTDAFKTALELWLPTVPATEYVEFILGDYSANVRPQGDGTYAWSIDGPATPATEYVETTPSRGASLLAALSYLESAKGQKP